MFLDDVIRNFVTIQWMYLTNLKLLNEPIDLCSAYIAHNTVWNLPWNEPDGAIQL